MELVAYETPANEDYKIYSSDLWPPSPETVMGENFFRMTTSFEHTLAHSLK